MKTKLKKWHIALMSFVALVFAIFTSLFNLKANPVDDETGEILTDNWELSTVFYDSTVNNGATPLTEINWDASDESYREGTSRTIIVQINYKNNSAVTTYQPGELKISIDNLVDYSQDAQIKKSIIIGANYSNNTGYLWNFTSSLGSSSFVFSNAESILEGSNFEGSIQIAYTITPLSEAVENFEDECIHAFSKEIQAYLTQTKSTNNKIYSNQLIFNYTRTYKHPWQKIEFELRKYANKITTLDYLPDASNYTWVNYSFLITPSITANRTKYPNLFGSNYYILDTFPSDCLVFDTSTRTQLYSETGEYIINQNAFDKIVVGYPKSIYNEENQNMQITNTAQLYCTYDSETEPEYVTEASVTFNLKDFEFSYTGSLYSIYKVQTNNYLKYEALTGQVNNLYRKAQNYLAYSLKFSTIYTGKSMDIKIGDDLGYIYDEVNGYRKLNEDEYYISNLWMRSLYDAYSNVVNYEREVYVRYAHETEYVLYGTYEGVKDINFPASSKVVDVYVLIKDVDCSIKADTATNSWEITVNYNKKDIEEEGTIYNFCYLEVYIDGELANPTTERNYSSIASKLLIATHDLEKYGHYQQRSYNSNNYSKVKLDQMNTNINAIKTAGAVTQNTKDECFTTSFSLTAELTDYSTERDFYEELKDLYTTELAFKGCIIYDLLPEGIELTSSEEDILNSITSRRATTSSYLTSRIYDKDINEIKVGDEIPYIKEYTSVEIIHNWRDSNRTMLIITVDMRDNPIMIPPSVYGTCYLAPTWTYSCKVSYDSFLEYGPTWTNYMYIEKINSANRLTNTVADIGTYETIVSDINENNNITETFSYAKTNLNITAIISTHQDVTTYVQTDLNTLTIGTADASINSEYEYKLRVRTGAADVTNLILYTNLEEAQPGRLRWKGSFLDIDTSYAEAKGYTVKTYYSENNKANNLYNEDGTKNSNWEEYIPDTPEVIANGLAITFDENFKTYNSSDYLCIYYYYNGQLYRTPSYYNTTLAGQTIEIPSTDIYFYWYTNSSGNSAYGFKIDNIEPKIITTPIGYTGYSLPDVALTELTGENYPETAHNPYANNSIILWRYTYTGNLILQEHIEHIDKTKVKSLAFEYLDSEGNPAVLPANSLTYVLINMRTPSDENIKTLARMDCWTQWNALDDYDRPVDFITGINSNVVKVALPNSIKEDSVPSITLKFIKEIQGTDSQFDYMQLDKADLQTFLIRLTSLTENDNGTYNQLTALLKSNQELIISQIPVGTYLLEELGDNYFDFVEFTDNNDSEIIIEGVTFERTEQGYIITVSEDLTEAIEFNIKVTNEIEDERFYEDKENKENLFFKNKINDNIMNPDDPQGH